MSDRFDYTCERCGDEVSLTLTEMSQRRSTTYGKRVLCDTCEPPPVVRPTRKAEIRPPALPPAELRLNLKPAERDDYGVTATVREIKTDRLMTITFGGLVIQALRKVCARVDGLAGTWRIVTLSTPASIFRDMQGARDRDDRTTEAVLLAQVGRPDLIDEARP